MTTEEKPLIDTGTCPHCGTDFGTLEPASKRPQSYNTDEGDLYYCPECGFALLRRNGNILKWESAETWDQRPEIPTKVIQARIPTFEQWFRSLDQTGVETVRRVDAYNERVRYYTQEDRKLSLFMAYRNEVLQLILEAIDPRCLEPIIEMRLFDCSPYSNQRIGFFHCSDLAKPDDPRRVNWHGQNTSQWNYAGACVVDLEDVSTHH